MNKASKAATKQNRSELEPEAGPAGDDDIEKIGASVRGTQSGRCPLHATAPRSLGAGGRLGPEGGALLRVLALPAPFTPSQSNGQNPAPNGQLGAFGEPSLGPKSAPHHHLEEPHPFGPPPTPFARYLTTGPGSGKGGFWILHFFTSLKCCDMITMAGNMLDGTHQQDSAPRRVCYACLVLSK